MKKLLLTSVFLLFFSLTTLTAQNLSVRTIQIGTDVDNRELVGADTAFSTDVGSVYCFTRITGAPDTTEVAHVWYYKDEEKARINLDIRSDDWRTWSSKSILEQWTGPWRVMVEDAEGNVIGETMFRVNGEE